jgi:hypothetical protein
MLGFYLCCYVQINVFINSFVISHNCFINMTTNSACAKKLNIYIFEFMWSSKLVSMKEVL